MPHEDPSSARQGHKRRGRPPLGSERALTRDRILATALEVSGVAGLEQLSMRGLASALDVDPASLYWHFPNREQLVIAALELASEEIEIAEPPDGPWRERSLAFCHGIRRAILRRPEFLRIQDQISVLTPFVVHTSRVLIEVLSATGLRGEDLVLSAQTLLWQTLGMTRIEVGLRGDPPPPEVVAEVSRLAVPETTDLGVDEWQSVASAYSSLTHAQFFDFAIRTTLDGIEHALACQETETGQ